MNPEAEKRKLSTSDVLGLSTELLASNHGVKLRLGGYSMYPSLKPGDIATIEQSPFKTLAPGDVITFKRQGRWIAHRLIKKETVQGETILHTKGDSCLKMDETVTAESYAGKIISIERNAKQFNMNIPYGKAIARNHYIYSLLFYVLVKVRRVLRFEY
ncbi:MAG: signal peptidase I [Bacteroidetes bacterium]|nr:signal peptidase I [Bacteroidota bacterium]